jgi:hypothetical protein
MVVASFFACRASLRATHYLLEALAPSGKVIARGHQGLADQHHDFLSFDLTVALASGLALVLGSQRRLLRHNSKYLALLCKAPMQEPPTKLHQT